MERKINLYLVRHAESVRNATLGLHDLDEDTCGLTEVGRSQAYLLGKHFKSIKFDGVYSSDYRRALETAMGILSGCQEGQSPQPNIETSEKLREVDLGVMKQSTYMERIRYLVKQMKNKENFGQIDFPGGESLWSAGSRMLQFLNNICSSHFKAYTKVVADNCSPLLNVLVISHSLLIGSLLHYLSYNDTIPHEMVNWNPAIDVKSLNNACYHKLQISMKSTRNPKMANGIIAWKIEAIEKNVSLYQNSSSKVLNNELHQSEEHSKISKFLLSSKEGKQIRNCYQQ